MAEFKNKIKNFVDTKILKKTHKKGGSGQTRFVQTVRKARWRNLFYFCLHAYAALIFRYGGPEDDFRPAREA